MLMWRHKQINQLKQGNAFNGEQASINQETGRILETCAQIQKRLGELNGRNKPKRHRWTHAWGRGGRVMRDRWNTSRQVTQETCTGWKWSHSDQSRGECLTTTGSDYECVTWCEDKHALGTGARYDTMHHASPLGQQKSYTVPVSERKTPTQQSPKKENSNTGPFIHIHTGKGNYFHPPCPVSLAISLLLFFILRSYSSHYTL